MSIILKYVPLRNIILFFWPNCTDQFNYNLCVRLLTNNTPAWELKNYITSEKTLRTYEECINYKRSKTVPIGSNW